MKIFTGVRLALLKVRHTGFWLFQVLTILASSFVMGGYYVLYDAEESGFRIKIIYEIIGIMIPLVSSFSIAFLVKLEEQIANMYGILAVHHRKTITMGMLLLSWSVIVSQLMVLTIFLAFLGGMEGIEVGKLLLLDGGMIIFGFFYPLFHFFLHLRFGIGVSMLFGVFECMQSVMYSNIEMAGVFRYIPFAWLMEWKTCILAEEWKESRGFWVVSLLMLIIYLVLLLSWFERWEGKKNYEQ